MVSIVNVHDIQGDRQSTWMTDEIDRWQRGHNWLRWLHADNPSSRIITFDYDSSPIRAGFNIVERFRETALQLLDGLITLRKEPESVAVCVMSMLRSCIGCP